MSETARGPFGGSIKKNASAIFNSAKKNPFTTAVSFETAGFSVSLLFALMEAGNSFAATMSMVGFAIAGILTLWLYMHTQNAQSDANARADQAKLDNSPQAFLGENTTGNLEAGL